MLRMRKAIPTISISDKRFRWSADEWRSIDIGHKIHQAVIEEGRAEGVFAYLYHSPDGRAWFEKYDRATKTVSRKFSQALAKRMIANRDHLRVYARYVRDGGEKVEGEKHATPPPRQVLS